MAKNNLIKNLRELDGGLTSLAVNIILGYIAITFITTLSIYVGGFIPGIFWIIGTTLGHFIYFRFRTKPLNPLNVYGARPPEYPDKKFYKRVDEYMKYACRGYRPEPVIAFSYGLILVGIILSISLPVYPPPNLEAIVAISAVGLTGDTVLVGGMQVFTKASKAIDSHKISKFFGVPESEWKGKRKK